MATDPSVSSASDHDISHDHFRLEQESTMLADCQKFVENQQSLDQADKYGITLLHIAAAKSYANVVRFLLTHHVNVDQCDDTGATALHLCAKHEQAFIVKLLLDAKANPTICDRFGRRASEVSPLNSSIRFLLLRAEEKYQRAEQSDDSLEENYHQQTVDSLSDDENDEFFFRSTTLKEDEIFIDDEPAMILEIFDEKCVDSQSSLPSKLANDDLAILPEISEQSLLHDLEMRYRQGQIYTYIGDILIALNPFELLPIYGRKISEMYKNTQLIPSLPPHIYGCAERLYRNMLREKTSQCVIISGLSGSGKTESCKYIVQHILSRSLSIETALNMKINQVNPLMEAFGNAKTYINNNSSRFGKYLEIHFSPTGNVLGAHLKEYLLEKSRVISHNNDEGNFHIFYYLFAGLSHEMLIRNGLRIPSEHRYMSHNVELAQLDNSRQVEYRKKFQMVKQSLISIGFSQDDVQSIFTILSSILHIGDLQFLPHGSNDGVRVKNNGTLEKIAELLQVSTIEFSSALVTELQVTRGEQIYRERNQIQASECRDAFAKALYGRLFSWIVNGINSYLRPIDEKNNATSAHTIAVLDIFGFENFKSNSFEQLCINLTNEHMQRFLNQHIYDLEIADCRDEGIEPIEINYTDNHLVIETFLNKHSGILAILDEESRFPQATNHTLATKLHHGPGVQFNEVYSIPKDNGTSFTIRHYAAPVVYNIVGLIDKNRDFLPNSIVSVARTSNNLIVQDLFRLNLNDKGILPPTPIHHPNTYHPARDAKRQHDSPIHSAVKHLQLASRTLPEKNNGNTFERTGGTAMRTVAFHFKHSLVELIDKMNQCQCHFVRCIKPNESREKNNPLTVPSVTRQLRYSGVLQMCEIRKKGYPLRIEFDEFLQRYNALVICLLPCPSTDEEKTVRDRAIECLRRAKIDNYQIGRRKFLFRYWHSDQLHNLSVQYEKRVHICQKVLRGWLTRKKYARLIEVHRLQVAFIRKFAEDISMKSQIYRQQLDQQQMIKMKKIDEDEEQIEKTLNLFDAMLDSYLSDQETIDEQKTKSKEKTNQLNQLNINTNQMTKHEFDGNISTNTSVSSSSSSTPSSSQKTAQRPAEIQASHFHQFQNIRCRFEQMTAAGGNAVAPTHPSSAPTNHVRRYTSENNLNALPLSKPIVHERSSRPLNPTSTEDLTKIPSWQKLSPQARLSALLDKTNHSSSSFASNVTSASLIDLTSIDKMNNHHDHQAIPAVAAARPRFRFVPPSDKNAVLQEEPELEQQQHHYPPPHPPPQQQQQQQQSQQKQQPQQKQQHQQQQKQQQQQPPLHFEQKPMPNNSNGLVKPVVIQRSTNFNHPNAASAFKPPSAPAVVLPMKHPHPSPTSVIQKSQIIAGNGALHKSSQQPPPVPNVKRTDSVNKPAVHVGLTNPSSKVTPAPRPQFQGNAPQFHQSMVNLSSIGSSDALHLHASPVPSQYGSRMSLQQTNPNNFMKHPAYAPVANPMNKSNGIYPAPRAPQSTQLMHDDPILKWIQQVNSSTPTAATTTTTIQQNGTPTRNSHQQQMYPYAPYISTGSGLPPASTNGSDHHHPPPRPYLNQVSVTKHHTPQHTVPVQSAAYVPRPSASSANIYRFHHPSAQIPISSSGHGLAGGGLGGGGGVPSSRHLPPQRPDVTVTTYL